LSKVPAYRLADSDPPCARQKRTAEADMSSRLAGVYPLIHRPVQSELFYTVAANSGLGVFIGAATLYILFFN
jgi:hypothetical protein